MAGKCIVGFAYAYIGNGLGYGERFDRLEECCEKFKIWFFDTGTNKSRSFNSSFREERAGINLTTRGLVSLIFKLTGPVKEDHLKFCPFCGAEIELKCTRNVELVPKTKEVPDGFEEITRWEEGKNKQA